VLDRVGRTAVFYRGRREKTGGAPTQPFGRPGGLAGGPTPPMIQSPVRGDGGLYSTASDYGRFMQLFLNGGRAGGYTIVRDATIRMMTSNQIGRVFVVQQGSANPALAKPFPFGGGQDKFRFGFH